MNVEELIKELRSYPSDLPVAIDIVGGYAILVNYTAGILRGDKPLVVCLGHKPSEEYFDKDTLRLQEEDDNE